MYNAHRGMMPHQAPAPSRLTELLDQIRTEFDSHSARAGEDEQRRDTLINQQISELEFVRQKVAELESRHFAMKEQYETKIRDLQRELDLRGGPSQAGHAASQHAGPTQQPPPSIGHGPRDLFAGIIAGNPNPQQQLGPMPEQPQHPVGLPVTLTQGAGVHTAPQVPHQPPFSGYPPSGGVNGYGHPPQPTASPNPGKSGPSRRPPGTATPQNQPPAFQVSPRSGPAPTPNTASRPPPAPQQPQIQDVGNHLSMLQNAELPSHLKSEGEEWWCIFNPQIRRRLNISLVHTLPHRSVVCCVRFSSDGRLVATGCNRAAQIFDVETGALHALLQDDTAEKEGDLYIRSVCFSPDGKYLATGAEDKIIRVWNIESREVVVQFTGHDQDIYSLDFSRNGRIIASGSGDKTVRLWDVEKKQPVMTLQIEDGVTTVALSGDGRLVAAGSLDRSVRVWDCETGRRLDLLDGSDGHGDSVYSVAFSPTSRELVSGSLDKTIKLWSLTQPRSGFSQGPQPSGGSGKCLRTFTGHADFVLSVALTPDGQWVLSGSKDRGVMFWDPNTGDSQLYLQGHRNSVISVAPSPTAGFFATGSGDMKARIWRYDTIPGHGSR